MVLSREEVAEIAKITAQAIIKTVREDRLTYHTPETVSQGLQESMGEELTASMWYQLRARDAQGKGDNETARLYKHIAAEENTHLDEFNKRLIEIS